jgi:hypothetical protein
MSSPPSICTACGSAPGPGLPAEPCVHCHALGDGVIWAPVRPMMRERMRRMLGAIALALASPWGVVLLVAALGRHPRWPEDWLQWVFIVLVAPILIVVGAVLFYFALELVFRRDWSFHTSDERRRGTLRVLWGRVLGGGGVFTEVETVHLDTGRLSSRVAHEAARELLESLLPTMRERFGAQLTWSAWASDARRHAELAVLSAILGLSARGRAVLSMERLGGWYWDRSRRGPRALPPRLSVKLARGESATSPWPTVGHGLGPGPRPRDIEQRRLSGRVDLAEDSAWLEQALLGELASEPRRVDQVIQSVAGSRLDPWGWLTEALEHDAPVYLAFDRMALDRILEGLLEEAPEVTLVLWSEIERGLMNSALTAHELWRFTHRPAGDETHLPN